MPAVTRRTILSLLGAPAFRLCGQQPEARGQGMASRRVKPAPRGKPSGLPFHARFTDVGAQAGLKEISVGGHPDRTDYIIETMSCGAAFFDYDNDGWLDILVLSGSRFGDPPADASNRLYKNNRDGTFTDVTEKAGPVSHRIRVRRDGRRLQQRRFRGSVHHRLGPERALSQQRRRHVHRCHERSRAAECQTALRVPDAPSWITIATAGWICSFPTTSSST